MKRSLYLMIKTTKSIQSIKLQIKAIHIYLQVLKQHYIRKMFFVDLKNQSESDSPISWIEYL